MKKYLGAEPGSLLGSVLRGMLDDIKYRIEEKNKDCFILVVGSLGEGKSTLASELCSYMDPTFKASRTVFRDYHYYRIKRQLVRGYDPIKTPGLCKKKAIQFDEVKRYLLAKESMKPEAIRLEMDLNDIRSLGFFMVGCIDEIKSATRWIRESRVQIIIYIPKLPEVWIYRLYKADGDNPFVEKIIQSLKKKLLDGEYPYTPYRSTFKAIPEKSPFWIEYSKRKSKYQINTAESKSHQKYLELKDRRDEFLKDYWSKRETANYLHMSFNTLDRLIKKNKIKPIRNKANNTLKFYIPDVKRLGVYWSGLRLPSLRVGKKPETDEYG